MVNKTLRIGVIGRHFGKNVHVPAFEMTENCEVAAVVSREWRSLIDDPSIDAVTIAVPPAVQREIALYALEHKKHVFLEKPMTADLVVSKKILSVAQEAGLTGMVNFELPFMKTWMEAKHQIDTGELGRLQRVDISWVTMSYSRGNFDDSWKFNPSLGGGLLNNFGCHVFNYVELFLGRLHSLSCKQQFVATQNDAPLDVAVHLNLKTDRDLPIEVTMDGRGPAPRHRIEIKGSHSALTLENNTADYVSGFVLKKGEEIVTDEKQALRYEDGRIWATHQTAKKFIESIRTGKLNSPSLQDGYRAEELIQLALQSNRLEQKSF